MSFNRTGVAAGIALAIASSAFAQDIKLNVTGTNIKRTEAETAAPITSTAARAATCSSAEEATTSSSGATRTTA